MAERDPILNQPPETVPLSTAAPPPPVVVVDQPARPAAQPAPQTTVVTPPAVVDDSEVHDHRELKLVSHSPLVYWWPVWVAGYVMAALTWMDGTPIVSGDRTYLVHPASYLGVLFFLILFTVIVISNIKIRGYASGMVVMTLITTAVIMAYFDAWKPVLGWLGHLNVFMNLGAYFWFSTLLLIVWAVTVFIVDRMSYWRVSPGQMTQEAVFGAASKSYDTENMVFEKHRDDLFRHWILGFGSGDLKIITHGARSEEISLRNVLFVGHKVARVQHLIAEEPNA